MSASIEADVWPPFKCVVDGDDAANVARLVRSRVVHALVYVVLSKVRLP